MYTIIFCWVKECLPNFNVWKEPSCIILGCVLSIIYLFNRIPSCLLGGKTLYEMLGDKGPYNEPKVFGCLYFVYNQGDKFAQGVGSACL